VSPAEYPAGRAYNRAMPSASAGDGVEIHYEERGSGPLVVIGSYWSMHPSALEPMIAELEGDHRVARYDDRGTGRSTRTGPYDMATGADDLSAVLAALGEPAVIVGVADAPSRAVRVAAAEPDSVIAVVCPGGAPIGRGSFETGETLATSESVVAALLQQVETDYRGTLRSLVGSTNQQMDAEELRERIAAQAEHVPAETGAARLRAWASDDPLPYARAAGDKVWVLVSDGITGGWFPTGADLARTVREVLPEANVGEISDGWVSRPDETAAAVRRITASVRVP
jgi:pimeloyl-ACP methyl ester carboxylesterase